MQGRNGVPMAMLMAEIDEAYAKHRIFKDKRLNDLKEHILQFAREEELEDQQLKAELKAVVRRFIPVFPELQRFEEIVVKYASDESRLKAETERFLESLPKEKEKILITREGAESMINKVKQGVRRWVPVLGT